MQARNMLEKTCAMKAPAIRAMKAGATADVISSVRRLLNVFFSKIIQYITKVGEARVTAILKIQIVKSPAFPRLFIL